MPMLPYKWDHLIDQHWFVDALLINWFVYMVVQIDASPIEGEQRYEVVVAGESKTRYCATKTGLDPETLNERMRTTVPYPCVPDVLTHFTMIIELVKYPVLTEKSVRLMDTNQYTFDVDLKLTKPQIRTLIEQLFQVEVIGVNTHRPPRKKRRMGYTQGNKASYKRVIVSVKRGQSIQILPTEK